MKYDYLMFPSGAGIRSKSISQLVSHVTPASIENACSHRHEVAAIRDH
jgi:hypothetical protein